MRNKPAAIVLALLAFLLIPALSAASASIDSCRTGGGWPNERCIATNAQSASDCALIKADSRYREQCYGNIARITENCSEISDTYQSAKTDCMVYQQFKKSGGNISSCGSIGAQYEQECYLYFVSQKYPADPEACEKIPPAYATECQKRALRAGMGFSPNEEYCNTVAEKYKALCIQTAKEQKTFFAIAAGMLAAFFGLMLSPLCCGAVVILGGLALLVFYLDRRNKGSKGRRAH